MLDHIPKALSLEDLKDTRFPTRGEEHLPTVVEVLGAEMRVEQIDPDWDRGPNLMDSARTLPTIEEVRSSLWLDAAEMARIRQSVYECHDLRVIRVNADGESEYLATRRVEPRAESNLSTPLDTAGDRLLHEVPINGCWWAPGGRVRAAREGSDLQKRGFDRIDSLLLKMNEELGLHPEAVKAIYYLGLGETKFDREMEYRYEAKDAEGESHAFILPVRMPQIQHTINHNYVVVLSADAIVEPRTLSSPTWIRRDDYDRHREQFLPYERKFVDAVFAKLAKP